MCDSFHISCDLDSFIHQRLFLEAGDTARNKMVKVSSFGKPFKEVSKNYPRGTETPVTVDVGLGKQDEQQSALSARGLKVEL